MSEKRLLLVGNPNSGKSTLFNALTGSDQSVGNWPGVTVERREGRLSVDGEALTIVDIPGIYSLDRFDCAGSVDESVARNAVATSPEDVIINVVDASNLERNLYLTLQLAEMKRPMVVALNMMDAAQERGFHIDVVRLSTLLGCPVVPCVASRKRGLDGLKAVLASPAAQEPRKPLELAYPEALAKAITRACDHLEKIGLGHDRAEGLELVEGAFENPHAQADTVKEIVATLKSELSDDLDIIVADVRYSHIRRITESALRLKGALGASLTERIDAVVLNRWLGIPVFLLMMYMLFFLTISLGGAFIDFFDGAAGALFVDGPKSWLTAAGAPLWVGAFLASGIGAGLQTVATFIPTIALLFLLLSFLEDSGYMARAAFVMDRFMRLIGLPGKAFVPLIVGFGCNVPAIMASRTLENDRDRKLTIMMAPFMSCGARLPVYAILVAAFFPTSGQNVVFSLYLIGIAMALATGFLMRRSLLAGGNSSFVLELPQYHIPTLNGILRKTWERLRGFIIRAGKVIVVMVAGLSILSAVDTSGRVGDVDPESSLLSAIGKSVTPLLAPIGISSDNWPATVGLITGVFAKEAVVGTMTPLYERLSGEKAPEETSEFSLVGSLKDAFLTIPANLLSLAGALGDPLGLGVINETATAGSAQAEMAKRFGSPWAAYAFLLFVLLYTPCVAVLGAIHKEIGMRWMILSAAWTTGVAYWVAALCFQISRLDSDPKGAALNLALLASALVLTLILLFGRRRYAARRNADLYPGASDGVAR